MRRPVPLIVFAATLLAAAAVADPPVIVDAQARAAGSDWSFSVTLAHPDTGWDHYADGWSVLAPDGAELGYRELLHPHETEQPFTRSLSGVAIPQDVGKVTVRARCSVDGWSGEPVEIELPR